MLTEAEQWRRERELVAARRDAPTANLGDLLILAGIVLVLALAIGWPR